MKLALLHSPEFQAQKEELYLSALHVTYKRFRLQPKPFSAYRASCGYRRGFASTLDSRIQTGLSGVGDKERTGLLLWQAV